MVKQTTIKSEISLKGVGLHTGKEVTMTFKPAPVNNGYTFVRVDLEGQPVVEADANYVVNTQRGTNLEKKGVKIQTSEHVLAAFVGCDVDNVIIELDASEPPIMDSRNFTGSITVPRSFILFFCASNISSLSGTILSWYFRYWTKCAETQLLFAPESTKVLTCNKIHFLCELFT